MNKNLSSAQVLDITTRASQLLKLGDEAIQTGHFEEAKFMFHAILDLDSRIIDEKVRFNTLKMLSQIEAKLGNFLKASQCLKNASAIEPLEADTFFELGNYLHQAQEFLFAIEAYDQAIEKKPDFIQALNNKGIALQELNQVDNAITCFVNALQFDPSYTDGWNSLGLALRGKNDFDAALECFDKAIDTMPYSALARINRADLKLHQENPQAALLDIEQVLLIDPNNSIALNLKGICHKELGQSEEALEALKKAISLSPQYPEPLINLADLLRELNQLNLALDCCNQAIQINPNLCEAYNNRGIIHLKRRDWAQAKSDLEHAIELKKDLTASYCNLGIALKELGKFDEALQSYDKAIALKPNYAIALNNRGVVLRELDRIQDAIQSHQAAIAIDIDYADAWNNLGLALKEDKQLDESLKAFNRALEIQPNNAKYHWNLSLLYLLQGNYEKGWPEYEWRWKDEDISRISGKRNYKEPLWLGKESLKGKTILIYFEQGLGDAIQMSRYFGMVANRGAKVIVEAPNPLVELFMTINGVSEVFKQGQKLPVVDFQCPIMSLPLAFKTTLDTIPDPTQFKVNKLKLDQWERLLGTKIKARIGLVWSGGLTHKDDSKRSFKLKDFLPLLSEEFDYICLQKEVRTEDLDDLNSNPKILFFGNLLQDFTDTAALIMQMDFIISVDTSVPHLAASLGKKTFLLVAKNNDWRWLALESESNWYKSINILRTGLNSSFFASLPSPKNHDLIGSAPHYLSTTIDKFH